MQHFINYWLPWFSASLSALLWLTIILGKPSYKELNMINTRQLHNCGHISLNLLLRFLFAWGKKPNGMNRWCSICLIIEHALSLWLNWDVKIVTNFSWESKTTEHSLLLNAGLALILKSTKENELRDIWLKILRKF